MRTRIFFFFALAGALAAQETVAPTPARVGTAAGDDVGNYNTTQSFELGYRWHRVDGDTGMYRSVVNFGNGVRLLGSSFALNSKEGHGRYFDEILLNTEGLGDDPYQSAAFRIQKNGLYRYEMSWRLNAYYNPGLTVAGGTHFRDTNRRLQDHELTLLPQGRFRLRVGYSRNTEDGPALSTAQEFDTISPAYPVFTDVRRAWNGYRLGFDADVAGFKFTLLKRWDYFKDDSPFTTSPGTAVSQFRRAEPVHGANPAWLGNLFTLRKLWGVNARLTYVSGRRDFVLDEFAAGTGQFGGAATRQILVTGSGRRPHLAGDLNLSLFPSDRLTVVNNTSVTSDRIDGDSSYTEINTGFNFGTNVSFRYLGIRTVTNYTEANYRARKWVGIFAGYRFSDRRIRTVEGLVDSDSQRYEVSNRLNTGAAGVRFTPVKPVRISLGGEIGRADNPLTPVAQRNYHALNGRAEYRTRRLQLMAGYKQAYNVNAPFSLASFGSHSRSYSGSASWSPRDWFAIDASYNKLHLDTVSSLAFFAGTGTRTQLQTAYSSLFRSNIHAANVGIRWAIGRRVDLYTGYGLTKDTGDGRAAAAPAGADPIQALLSSVQTFPLTYQSPLARVSVRITPKVRWNAGWQFYRYGEEFHVFGYNQDYRAHTGYTSVLWSF